MGTMKPKDMRDRERKRNLERLEFAKRVREGQPRATEAQVRYIKNIIRKKQWSDDHAISELRATVGLWSAQETVTHPEHLTKAEASTFIRKWADNG
jgi:hypothetical protein